MGNVVSMDKGSASFNRGSGRWAPTANISLVTGAVEEALSRSPNLPGIVVLYGASGLGKTMAASFCANKFEGIHVEAHSYFNRKNFVLAILKEMGIRPGRTLGEMMEQAAEQLDLSGRPLIIDEGDHLMQRNIIELVRDLHEMAHATILLIGEDQFPGKLLRYSERFHNRVLGWCLAQPTGLSDARQLARFYLSPIEVEDDLLAAVVKASGGLARRVCVNLELVRQHCVKRGLKKIDLTAWGKRPFYTGEAPRRGLRRDPDEDGGRE